MVKLACGALLLACQVFIARCGAVSLDLLQEASVELPEDFAYTYEAGQLDAPSLILLGEKKGCKIRFESAGTIVTPEEFARLNGSRMVQNLYRDYREFEPQGFSAPEFYQVGTLPAVRTEGSILLDGQRRFLRVNTINLKHVMLHVLEYAAEADDSYKGLCFNTTGQIISTLKNYADD